MGRMPLAVGTLGEIRYTPKDGKITGRADGRVNQYRKQQVQRSGKSKAAVKLLVEAAWRQVLSEDAMKTESASVAANFERAERQLAVQAAEAAQALAEEAAAKISRNGGDPDAWTPQTLLSTLIDRWFTRLPAPPKLSASTLRQYGQIAIKLRAGIGHISLEDLTIARIETYLEETRDATSRGSWGDQCKTALGAILQVAVKHEIIATNRAKLADYEPLPAVKGRSLTEAEIAAIDAAVRRYDAGEAGKSGPKPTGHLTTAVTMFKATGVRTGELLALRWGDVDFKKGTIDINGTLIAPKGPVRRQDHPKSKSGYRTLSLPRYAVEELARHFVRSQREAGYYGWTFDEAFPVFPSRVGGWFRDSRLRLQFRMATKHLCIEGLEFYSYRRTISTKLAEGRDGYAAAAQLGHSSPDVTRRHYIQQSTDVDNAAALEEGDGEHEDVE